MLDLDEESDSIGSGKNEILTKIGLGIICSGLVFALLCIGYIKVDMVTKNSSEGDALSSVVSEVVNTEVNDTKKVIEN